MPEFPHAEITGAIIGAFFHVYNELGHGFGESIYRRALCILLRERGFTALEEMRVTVDYHGHRIGTFCIDIGVRSNDGAWIVVEVKATRDLEPRDEAQVLNYLKCAGGGIGLLLNFGREPKHRRFVMGDAHANLPNLVTE